MSYKNLARRYRPTNFTQMVGQPHVLKALVNSIKADRIHHAYLFTGTRGIGKTTVARIFAKCLNCHSNITVEPCGTCVSCNEINNGNCVDLIEIDAASRTKVEDTRELLANIQYAPIHSRFKIYLIDEVHMLSLQSFNALLKTLEEPPEHIKFLLATTDPQKIPVTILSRCLQFHLKQMIPDSISSYIEQVLIKENINFEVSALNYIAKAANGSMRDALSITDQAIAYTNSNLTSVEISNMLGSVDNNILLDILHSVATKNIKSAISLIRTLAKQSPDFSLVFADLLAIINDLTLMQVDPELSIVYRQNQSACNLATLFTPEELQLCYQITINAKKDALVIEDSKSIFEMAILRMIAFSPEQIVTTDYTEYSQNQDQPQAITETTVTQAASSLQLSGNNSFNDENQLKKLESNQPSVKHNIEQSTLETTKKQNDIKLSNQQDNPHTENKPSSEITAENWHLCFFKLAISGMARSIFINCSYSNYQANKLQLNISKDHYELLQQQHKLELQNALQKQFNKEILIDLKIDTHKTITPYQWIINYKQQQLKKATKELTQDQIINDFTNCFDAKLVNNSVTINKL